MLVNRNADVIISDVVDDPTGRVEKTTANPVEARAFVEYDKATSPKRAGGKDVDISLELTFTGSVSVAAGQTILYNSSYFEVVGVLPNNLSARKAVSKEVQCKDDKRL